MNGVVDWAASRARMVLAFIILSLTAGIAAYVGLPKEGEPDIEIPALFVSVPFPGISAEDSENLLVRPMEQELADIDGLKTMTGTAAENYAGLALDPETPIKWSADKDDDGPEMLAPEAGGSARAAGSGAETTNAGALVGLPELASRGRLGVRKVFDDKFMVANDRWLATLSDVPGDYLAARISHEFKRRRDLGLLPPDPEDPR